MAEVVAIGHPVNDVERHAVALLRDELPDDYIVVHNVELGEPGRAPYEYDVVVIGEHAVYAVEVKGYFGHVTGNKRDWQVRGRHRRSPLPLAFQKARILSSQLRRAKPQLGQLWVEAVVFLANTQVDPEFPPEVAEHVRTCETIVAALTDPSCLHLPHWDIKPAKPWSRAIRRVLLGGRPSPGRTHVGPYRLLGQVGQTELFTDYEATNEALVDPDAANGPIIRLRLYRVDPYAPPEEIERQRQRGIWEASVLRWLGDHPGLVSAGDPFFPEAEDLAVALPFEQVGGITLRSYLEARGPLDEDDALELFGPAIEALALAHSRGIVHRRLTPDAFLYEPGEPLRLADFAYSARVATGEPIDEALLHHRFSAPELLDGGPARPSADMFSLGAVLAFALTGPLPFDDSRQVAVPEALRRDTPLARAVRALLDPDPAARPKDGYALLELLLPDAAGAAVIARRGARLLADGAVLNGTYRVLRRLGPPRTRTTYEVEHLVARQRRVLSVLEVAETGLDALREAFAKLYALRHPALMRVNELDRLRSPELPPEDGRLLYLVDREHAAGEPLVKRLHRGPLGVRCAAGVLLELIDLVGYLDERGVHHGGLSSHAVFLDGERRTLVAPPPSLWPPEALSPPALRYVNPTSPPSLAEDLAAAAILAWEMACGCHPFPGGLREPGSAPQLDLTAAPADEREPLRALASAVRRFLRADTGEPATSSLEEISESLRPLASM